MIGLLAFAIASNGVYYDDGNDFLRVCQDRRQEQFCLGYSGGIAAGFHLGDAHSKGHTLCLPPKATNQVFEDTIVAFLRANPSMRGQPASTLSALALIRAFPCRK